MAYDRGRGRVVLFGGSAGSELADTWEWDGTNWTLRAPNAAPRGRRSHAMAYDSSRQRVVLVGGAHGQPIARSLFADTWEWDGTTWTLRYDYPPRLTDAAMTEDSVRRRVLLFGSTTTSTATSTAAGS